MVSAHAVTVCTQLHEFESLGPAPLQKCVGDFCCVKFGGCCRGFSWRIFLGTFSHKNEEKNSGEKIREKIFFLQSKHHVSHVALKRQSTGYAEAVLCSSAARCCAMVRSLESWDKVSAGWLKMGAGHADAIHLAQKGEGPES